MTIPQLHMYDLKTGEYTGSRDATRRPNGEYMLEATGATPVALPAGIPFLFLPRGRPAVYARPGRGGPA